MRNKKKKELEKKIVELESENETLRSAHDKLTDTVRNLVSALEEAGVLETPSGFCSSGYSMREDVAFYSSGHLVETLVTVNLLLKHLNLSVKTQPQRTVLENVPPAEPKEGE